MIRTVLFDLDGTLLDRDASVQQFAQAQHQRFVEPLRHVLKQEYVARWIELDCHGHVWKDEVYRQLVCEFDIIELSWQELLHDYETQFMFHSVPFPGLFETLSALQDRYALGIITNGRGIFQSRVLQGLKIQNFFNAVLISEIEQVRKPQIEIFHRALRKLNATASETVFVGDHPEADVNGAKSADLKTIWKRNSLWPKSKNADAIINGLEELPALIRQF